MNDASQCSCHSVVSTHTDSGLGHVSCFGQWDISQSDTSRGLISTCTVGSSYTLLLGALSCHIKKSSYPAEGPTEKERMKSHMEERCSNLHEEGRSSRHANVPLSLQVTPFPTTI